jgi:hypothetical protein
MIMMFKKKKTAENPETPKMCLYCENATVINDDDNVLCSLKGIVKKEYRCKKCEYDPLKRIPSPMPPMPRLSEDAVLI